MRALVLGGGGSKGAFAVGAVQVLRQAGIQWDVIVGCSVGALLAPLVALDAIDELVEIFSTITNGQVYRERKPLELLAHRSLYDSDPLWLLINRVITEERYAKLSTDSRLPMPYVTTTHLQSGKSQSFAALPGFPRVNFLRAMLASASQPVLFPLVEIFDDHQQYCDGGVAEVVPLSLPIKLGADILDVVILEPEVVPPLTTVYATFLATLGRTIDTLVSTSTAKDIRFARLINEELRYQDSEPDPRFEYQAAQRPANPLAGKRLVTLNVIRPTNILIENSLEFNPIASTIMMELGRDAAKTFLAQKGTA